RLLTEPPRPAAIRESPRAPWLIVGTVCIGAFMGQLDASIVTLALPQLGRDLHSTVGAVEWVALSYLLVLVAAVTPVGHLADSVGRKLLYVYGFGVFTIGSALCAVAPTLALLIGARVLQAVGAAMLQANSVALITEAMPRPLLARAIGVQGTFQALGLALGPAVGGALLALGGWRLIFLVNLPAGAVGLVLGWVLLPRSHQRLRRSGPADRLGPQLLALAAGGPLLYLSLAGHSGYASPALLVALAVGLLAACLFVRHEHRHPKPMIDLSLLRRPALSAGLSSGLVSYLVLFGTLFVVPYYLEASGVGSAVAGLRLAVLPLAIGIAAPLAGRHVERFGERPFTVGGLVLAACGLLVLALWQQTIGLLAGLAIVGVGIGGFTPANNVTIMMSAPERRTGLVGGLLNMTRGLGTAIGVAVAALLYTTAAGVSGAGAAAQVGRSAAGHGLRVAIGGMAIAALATGVALLLQSARRAWGGCSAGTSKAGRLVVREGRSDARE
ncbi:MAG: MFS transporter, partial [Solirubrobacteraceae bacterium]